LVRNWYFRVIYCNNNMMYLRRALRASKLYNQFFHEIVTRFCTIIRNSKIDQVCWLFREFAININIYTKYCCIKQFDWIFISNDPSTHPQLMLSSKYIFTQTCSMSSCGCTSMIISNALLKGFGFSQYSWLLAKL